MIHGLFTDQFRFSIFGHSGKMACPVTDTSASKFLPVRRKHLHGVFLDQNLYPTPTSGVGRARNPSLFICVSTLAESTMFAPGFHLNPALTLLIE
jgi:hypothetical protein